MKTLAKILVLVSLALSQPAFATCVQMTDAQIQEEIAKHYPSFKLLNVPTRFTELTKSIEPTLEIGGVIATATSTPFNTSYNFADCPGGGIVQINPTGTPSALANVYRSNVPGIGYRISYVRASGSTSILPYAANIPSGPASGNWARFGTGSFFRIELIKTGEIGSQSRVMLNGVGTGFSNGDHKQVIAITSGSITVKVLPSCSVNTKQLNINFGTFGPSDVSQLSGPTRPVSFTVQCTGPTQPASITASLSGTPDPENPSLIKNEGAAHLAIRMRDTHTSEILKPNDPNSTLVQQPGSQSQSLFLLEATVLRVGTATPPPGKIQATATITMTLL